MRLAAKIFLVSAVVVLVLLGSALWSLVTVKRLVTMNRNVVTRVVPALRVESSLRNGVESLVRLETRALVLRDPEYAAAWDGRVAEVRRDLETVAAHLESGEERDAQAMARGALQDYRDRVSEERRLVALGRGAAALAIAEGPARDAVERLQTALAAMRTSTEGTLALAEARARTLERRTWRAVGAALATGLALALAASAWLAHRMTRSLRHLSVAAAALAAGSWPAPLTVTGHDEISDLGRSFNQMAERLRQADRVKEEFLSHISHDLRNPLAAIRLSTESVLERALAAGDTKQARFAQLIALSAQRMLTMVNQILDFTRLRAHAVPLDRQPIDMQKAVAQAIDELRPLAQEKRLDLELCADGAEFGVLADEGSLIRMVINLVGNAVAFTPDRGSIEVWVIEGADHIELRVQDTGVGIPADMLPVIFEPYRQAHGERKGIGLGLAVVKGLVEAHGGTISVRSAAGQGSCFTVRLPKLEVAG
jgi:signal transduction histidine kinase